MTGKWVFDAAVARSFNSHAQQHIPDYLAVVDDAVLLAKMTCEADASILEVGCATGETLRRLRATGFCNLVGVDIAPAMLAQCDPLDAYLILSDVFPVARAPFRLVLANWTLHFLEPAKRLEYFAAIYAGLEAGGYLMLTEKCVQSDALAAFYHGWKADMGVSQEEITRKEKALRGVLFAMPASWIVNALAGVGFSVDVWRASHGFVTFLAEKK